MIKVRGGMRAAALDGYSHVHLGFVALVVGSVGGLGGEERRGWPRWTTLGSELSVCG